MINVSNKITTLRFARACGKLKTTEEVIQRIKDGGVGKGDVIEISRAAGIQAAKKTSELLTFCHNLPLEWVEIQTTLGVNTIDMEASAECISRTGVEMEALTAVSTALLNAYDMLKPYDKNMEITGISLLEKRGGKSDFSHSSQKKLRAALLRITNKPTGDTRAQKATHKVAGILEHQNIRVDETLTVLPDEVEIRNTLNRLAESGAFDLIFTVGATGLSENDTVSKVTRAICDTTVPGIAENMRAFGSQRTPYAMFSRGTAGIKGGTLIINLPGSTRGAEESLSALFPGLHHALRMINRGRS